MCDFACATRSVLDGVYTITFLQHLQYREHQTSFAPKRREQKILRAVLFTAATNSLFSHALRFVRSIGVSSGNISRSCGVMLPLNPFDSTAVRIAGTPKILADFARSN